MMHQNLNGMKVINHDAFDFTNSAVIRPEKHEPTAEAYTRIVVSSYDRDHTIYPEPNDYVFMLYEQLEDVSAIELDVADISPTPYNVSKWNNTLIVVLEDTHQERTVTLAPGVYGVMDIRDGLEGGLKAAFPQAKFKIMFDDIKCHFVLLCDQRFQLRPSPNTMYKVLGFGRGNVYLCRRTDDVEHPFGLESPYCSLLEAESPIILHIDGMGSMNSMNRSIHKGLFIIPRKGVPETRVNSNYKIRKSFNPPLPKVSSLRIRFMNVHGELYDFQNRDHIIELMFSYRSNNRRYHSYI